MNKFTYFWGAASPFSNWYEQAPFLVNGVKYLCMEQYMMAGKARVFGDVDTQKRIMEATNPAQHKALGRAVRNFNEGVWNAVSWDIVYTGLCAKFSQNKKIYREMMDAVGPFVEASPYDKIWGIGLSEETAKSMPPHQWPGENRLGHLLDSVKLTFTYAEIRNGEKLSKLLMN